MSTAVYLLIIVNFHYVLPQEPSSTLVIGPVQGCATITSLNFYCSKYVTYEVPASIAWLAEIIDSDIRNVVDSSDIGSCQEVLRETYCKQKFPRCLTESNMVKFERSANCTERLQRNCGPLAVSVINSGFCNTTQVLLNSGSCDALSSHRDLQHCNQLETSLHVSNWMYQYILQTDLMLQEVFSSLGERPECWMLYRRFICTSLGQCIGEQVYLTNTQELCESVLDCYPDDISALLRNFLTCNSWPSQSQLKVRPTSSSDPLTRLSPNPVVTTYQWVMPHDRTFAFSSSSYTTKAKLCITCTLLFIHFMIWHYI